MQNNLTPRQLEILHLIARGLSNKDVGRLLEISVNTVKIHVAAILRLLAVANRTEAVAAYQQLQLQAAQNPSPNGRLQLVDRLGRPAIAVLPFEDLRDQRDDDHLMQGLVEELLVRLSAWRWFPVIAYASSRRFDPTEHDPQLLGAELAARYLVYGSVRRSADRVRVVVRLVDTDHAQEIWSRTFDGQFVDLFDLQEEIATHVVSVMAPELVNAEARHVRAQTENSSAWELVCKGVALLDAHNRTSCDEALQVFEAAIAMAPDFDLGWHGKVCALQQKLFDQWTDNPAATVRDMAASAERCHAIDPDSAHALTNMGLVKILAGQRDAALSYLEQAIAINPSSTRALSTLAQAVGMDGRLDECVMHMEELLRIDPRSPATTRYRTIMGMCQAMGSDPRSAIDTCNAAIARDAQAQGAYLALIAAHVELDELPAAKSVHAALIANNPDFQPAARIAMMRPFTAPELLARLTDNLQKAGVALK